MNGGCPERSMVEASQSGGLCCFSRMASRPAREEGGRMREAGNLDRERSISLPIIYFLGRMFCFLLYCRSGVRTTLDLFEGERGAERGYNNSVHYCSTFFVSHPCWGLQNSTEVRWQGWFSLYCGENPGPSGLFCFVYVPHQQQSPQATDWCSWRKRVDTCNRGRSSKLDSGGKIYSAIKFGLARPTYLRTEGGAVRNDLFSGLVYREVWRRRKSGGSVILTEKSYRVSERAPCEGFFGSAITKGKGAWAFFFSYEEGGETHTRRGENTLVLNNKVVIPL